VKLLRLMHAQKIAGTADLAAAVFPSLLGAVFAFLAGLVALRWLSRWLEHGAGMSLGFTA